MNGWTRGQKGSEERQSSQEWAAAQCAGAQLPDGRLNERMVRVLATLAEKPLDSIPQGHDDWGQAKATYRFVENERVTVGALQAVVADATARQCADRGAVMLIQDTTGVSLPKAQAAQLGPIGPADSHGLWLHSVLAVGDDGLALGVVDLQIWSRDPQERGCAESRRQRPLEEKESAKWLRGMRGAREAIQRTVPSDHRPRRIHVMDREGDIHEVFEQVIAWGDGAVIRSAWDRRIEGEDSSLAHAHSTVRASAPLTAVTLDVPRKQGEAARKATVEVRSCQVRLAPNPYRHPNRQPVALTLVEVWEPNRPEGLEPLHWLLWTTEPAETASEALGVVRIYKMRWKIEDYHLVLKGGCRIEELQFETVARLAKMISLYAPVAVRILQMRDLSRQQPDTPCSVLLSRLEWHTLWARIHRQRPAPDQVPPTLRQAVLWIGRLGGHLNRKSDGMPGVRSLWRGWRDLLLMTSVYALAPP